MEIEEYVIGKNVEKPTDTTQFYMSCRAVYKYIKSFPNVMRKDIYRGFQQRIKQLDKILFKLREEGFVIEKLVEEIKKGRTYKKRRYCVTDKEMPEEWGVEKNCLNVKTGDQYKLLESLKESLARAGDLKKSAAKWTELRPDFLNLFSRVLMESISYEEILKMSAYNRISKASELIEKELMLRGKLNTNNFTVNIFEQAYNKLFKESPVEVNSDGNKSH